MMIALDALCVLAALGLYIAILVDMFRRSAWWGLLGLVAFVPAYYFVVRHYTGKRRVIAPLFFLTTLIPAFHLYGFSQQADRLVQPFVQSLNQKIGAACEFTGDFAMSGGKTSYLVLCDPKVQNQAAFKNVEEMMASYRASYAQPMLAFYQESLGANPSTAVKLGIRSPFKAVACFELFEGKIAKAWATGPEQACTE